MVITPKQADNTMTRNTRRFTGKLPKADELASPVWADTPEQRTQWEETLEAEAARAPYVYDRGRPDECEFRTRRSCGRWRSRRPRSSKGSGTRPCAGGPGNETPISIRCRRPLGAGRAGA